MCGIAGVISENIHSINAEQTAKQMAFALAHRGPDGAGYYSDEGALLVHTRLSIIDLSHGHQPIHNEDKSIWVTFNGEIYNFIELRAELKALGHDFYTHSDTEVLVHLYEQYGSDFVHKLNGQFAICLWDKNNKTCFLARDRVGIAPLYYTIHNRELIFGSEIKAILAYTNTSPRLNLTALDQLLTFWAPVSPNTIFQDIYELSPGHRATFCKGELKINSYWDMQFPPEKNYFSESESDITAHIRDLLLDAVKIRLRADVPVSAYLSGGLDSSILASCIKQLMTEKFNTFSITFADKALDESQYQTQMANKLGTRHHSINCTNSDIAENFIASIWHTESPILRTAPVPMGLLSGLVRKNNFKVVLTGEGADEVFGGYDLFKETKLREFWSRNPSSAWRPQLIKKLYPYLDLPNNGAAVFLQNFFGSGVDNPDNIFFSHLPRWLTTSKIKSFYSESSSDKLRENAQDQLRANLPNNFNGLSRFNKAQYLEVKTLMSGYLLSAQGDRMLMKNGVEGRLPFLDHRLIEFVNSIDPRLKMRVLNEKYILKKAMGDLLPAQITKRHKQPYRSPDIPAFFGAHKVDYVEELLSQNKLDQTGYFDGKKVGMLVKKLKTGRFFGNKDSMALTGILSTQVWHHLFIENFHPNCSAKTGTALGVQRMN